jgi:hypothetical protein
MAKIMMRKFLITLLCIIAFAFNPLITQPVYAGKELGICSKPGFVQRYAKDVRADVMYLRGSKPPNIQQGTPLPQIEVWNNKANDQSDTFRLPNLKAPLSYYAMDAEPRRQDGTRGEVRWVASAQNLAPGSYRWFDWYYTKDHYRSFCEYK